MEQNLFEQATRLKMRFDSDRGQLNVEQLWDLPLVAKSGTFDLDSIAKSVKRDLDAASTESFVRSSSPASVVLTMKLDLVKSIIATKLNERAIAQKASERKAELGRLKELLADKQNDELKNLTAEQIQARIAELDE